MGPNAIGKLELDARGLMFPTGDLESDKDLKDSVEFVAFSRMGSSKLSSSMLSLPVFSRTVKGNLLSLLATPI